MKTTEIRTLVRELIAEAKKAKGKMVKTSVGDRLKMIDEAGDKAALQAKIAKIDEAETVREVKLVYETVSKNVVTKPVTIKEHKSFASKSAGTASTAGKKEVISEVNEQVARWQKLAGIIK